MIKDTIYLAKDVENDNFYKVSDSDLSKNSVIIDSIGSKAHTKILSKIMDHQISNDAPLMLIQYKADHNKAELEKIVKKLNREEDYKNLNKIPVSNILRTLLTAVRTKSIIYVDLEEDKSDMHGFIIDFLPTLMYKFGRKKPLHIIVTQANCFNDLIWGRLIHSGCKDNLRTTFVYDHYTDTTVYHSSLHQQIANNTYIQFFFKQIPKNIDLLNSAFRLIKKPSSTLDRFNYFIFKRKYELRFLKTNECLIQKYDTLSKVRFK